MKLIIERPYKVIKQSECEVDDLNVSTLQKICELEYKETDPIYLEDTCSIDGATKIYSEDKSILLYTGK